MSICIKVSIKKFKGAVQNFLKHFFINIIKITYAHTCLSRHIQPVAHQVVYKTTIQNFKTNIINKQNNYVQMTVQLCVVFDCDDYLMGFKLKNNTNL